MLLPLLLNNLLTGGGGGTEHALLADDVQSTSEVSSPSLGQVHVLDATNVQSTSQLTSPVLGQSHVLTADDVEAASEVSAPVLSASGEHALLAVSVEARSELSTPTLDRDRQGSTGGWAFHNDYELELRRRRKRKKEQDELEAETERIENEVDRSIAQLLREQEAIDAKRDDLNRLKELAKKHADLEAARQYSERVATAFERALAQGNFSAMEALDRELQRARDDEDLMTMAAHFFLLH